jgi:DNA-binding response OmpR family regulator
VAGHGRTVLLAGAAWHTRELMAGALADMGCAVVQAADGPTLLEQRAAMGAPPGLIVIGADLPGRSGLDCLSELRRAGDRTPAIVICEGPGGSAGLDERSSALFEPFPMSELVSMVARLLESPAGAEDRP